MIDPDLEAVEKAKQGDKRAFSKLVDQYYEMVYAVCVGVLQLREPARDTAQEVFLKVYQEISHFKGGSKFKTWLYRIAMNAAIDAVRRRKRQVSLDATDASEDDEQAPVIIPDSGPGPREDAAGEEMKKLMKLALEQLSPEHRAVLVLREWEDLSYEEIAETLQIEIGTVMSRIFYARKKMGEALQRMGAGPAVIRRKPESQR